MHLLRRRIDELIETSPRFRLLARALAESKHVSTLRGVPHRDQYARIGDMHLQPQVQSRAAAASEAAFREQQQEFAKKLYGLVGQYQRLHVRNVAMRAPSTPDEVARAGGNPSRQRERQKRHALWSRSRVNTKASEIRDLFRENYLQAYRRGIGTTVSLAHETPALISPEEARWLESAVRHEMRYFNRLLLQVRGNRSPAGFKHRVDRYTATLEAFFRAGQVAGQHPNTVIHWVMDPRLENCPDCLELSRKGPFTKDSLPTTPKAGATRCVIDPSAPVWTARGLVPISQVVVGDQVWTHRGRLRPVMATPRSTAGPGRESAVVGGVSFTADHRVFTWDGWRTLSEIAHVGLRMIHPQHVDSLLELFGPDAFGPAHSPVPSLRECLSNLWEDEGSESTGVRQLWEASESQAAVGSGWFDYSRGSEGETYSLERSDGGQLLLEEDGWPKVREVLGGRQAEDHLSVSVGMDGASWGDTVLGYGASQERGLHGRSIGESGVVESPSSHLSARFSRDSHLVSAYCSWSVSSSIGELCSLWKRVSSRYSPTIEWCSTTREVLLTGVCRTGTTLYDLTVFEDESFIVGDGVIAQNCLDRCGCHLEYEKLDQATFERLRDASKSGMGNLRSFRRQRGA